MANDILIIAEHRGGQIKKVTVEAIGVGKMMAGNLGGDVHVAILGNGVQALADKLQGYGVQVSLFEDAKL